MITIRVKDSILEQIDVAAEKAGMSRAQFMIAGALGFANPRPAAALPEPHQDQCKCGGTIGFISGSRRCMTCWKAQ